MTVWRPTGGGGGGGGYNGGGDCNGSGCVGRGEVSGANGGSYGVWGSENEL